MSKNRKIKRPQVKELNEVIVVKRSVMRKRLGGITRSINYVGGPIGPN